MKAMTIIFLTVLPFYVLGQRQEEKRFNNPSDTFLLEQHDKLNYSQSYCKTVPLVKHPSLYSKQFSTDNYIDSFQDTIFPNHRMPVHVPDISSVIPIPLAEIDTTIRYALRIKELK